MTAAFAPTAPNPLRDPRDSHWFGLRRDDPHRPPRRRRRTRLHRQHPGPEPAAGLGSCERRLAREDHRLLRRPPGRVARAGGAVPDRCRRPHDVRRFRRLPGTRSGANSRHRRWAQRRGTGRGRSRSSPRPSVAMSTYVHRGAPDPSVVSALWLTHMSVFCVNLMFIAVTLVGLTTAVREDGRRATGLAEGRPRRSRGARCRRRLHAGHLGRQPGVRARTRRLPHLGQCSSSRLRSRCCADPLPTEVPGEDDAGLALPVVVLDPVLGESHRSVKGA